MKAVAAFAPGKLFVVGEYAVLSGGRALVAGIDAGVRCRMEAVAGAGSLCAPDLGFDGSLDAASAHPGARLLAAAVRAGTESFGLAGALEVTVEGAHPLARRKLGLGGSAASVVAVLAATAALAGEDPSDRALRRRLFPIALEVHRAHQQGRGSGADVAAGLFGGWVDFSWRDGRPAIERAALPDGLRLAAAWSGVERNTAEAIAEFEERHGPSATAANESSAVLSRLRSVLDRFWAAADRDDRAALLREITLYGEALANVAGAGDRCRELVRSAQAAGAAAKGSGASGGDCAIALTFDATTIERVEAAWRMLGSEVLGLQIDSRGARAE